MEIKTTTARKEHIDIINNYEDLIKYLIRLQQQYIQEEKWTKEYNHKCRLERYKSQ